MSLFKQGNRLHAIFLISLFLITAIVTMQSQFYKQVAPKALTVYMLMVLCIYAGRWLTRQFVIRNKWTTLIILFCLLVGLFSASGILSMAYLLNIKDGEDLSALIVTTLLLVILALFGGGLIALSRVVIRQQIKEISILRHQSETELNLLTNKLSPHFLFNTLNNLYGLARNDHTRVPELLLKLADLLSYTLYSAEEPFVQLQKEVDYIQNFTELEKIRISDRLILDVNIAEFDRNINIAPMILIVFVENAFKHSKNTKTRQIRISIKLWVQDQFIHFKVENSATDQPELQKTNNGLGIATTIKRLDLLYKDMYSLNYGIQEKDYIVNLKVPQNANH